ncbi:sensor domain-containing protein [Gordonia otitidis]|uniref:Signaling protein n=1 Tax=Gordonia otitidis (strain DSM 44809 / CCUG 52243 / JCM 12355 / NBRC 100426 / IFM 10032) TaxID=1108044 RepID=H5TSC3_GORO1|nr:EAL domain-containing protein [Gordonia otitidis]GAB36381.1 hypothetical protein GOOTI_214_00070 [Gordonia otitidis NBRC 100426]
MADEASPSPERRDPVDVASSDPGLAERYRLLLELSPDAIAVHQLGVIVWVNSAALKFARLSHRDDMIGALITDFVHPDSLPEMVNRLSEMGEQDGAYAGPDEVTMVDAYGDPRPMTVTSVRTRWDGQPAYQVILRDITSLRRQAALINHVSDAVISASDELVIRTWNPAAEQLYGIPVSDAVGMPLNALGVVDESHSPEDIVGVGGVIHAIHRRADTGHTFAARVAASVMDDGYLLVVQPVRTPLVRRLGTILAALQQAVILVRDSPDGGRIELANPSAVLMLGLSARSIPGTPLTDLPLEFAESPSPIEMALRLGDTFSDQIATANTLSGTRWLSCSGRRIDTEESAAVVLVSVTDVTEQHHAVSDLTWQAKHDHLTGVLSRAALSEQIDLKIREMVDGDRLAIYFLDLDGFKLVNDTRGHSAGDEVLRIVSQRLQEAVGTHGCVGRIGGDEFIVVSSHNAVNLDAAIHAQIDAMRDVVGRPIDLSGTAEYVSASVGLALAKAGEHTTADDLLRDADIALYEAKNANVPYVSFNPQQRANVLELRNTARDLRSDLESGAVRLDYEPIVRCCPDTPVVAFDAVLRWEREGVGHHGPRDAVVAAEHSRLVPELSGFVISTATAAFTGPDWPHGCRLTVRMSRNQVCSAGFLPSIDAAIGAGLDPARLCIIVAEFAVADDPATLSIVSQLNARSIAVALDDFGAGMSTLAILHRLPVTTVRIARAFTDTIAVDSRAAATLGKLVELTHELEMNVAVKGVDNRQQADVITQLGVDFAQGAHFGAARRAPTFTTGPILPADAP